MFKYARLQTKKGKEIFAIEYENKFQFHIGSIKKLKLNEQEMFCLMATIDELKTEVSADLT